MARAAHALKSSSRSIGAAKLADQLEVIERSSRRMEATSLDELRAYYDEALVALESVAGAATSPA